MNGRLESELKYEKKINEILRNVPSIFTNFYYYLSGSNKSFTTMFNYTNYVIEFYHFMLQSCNDEDFYTHVLSTDINRYFAAMRTWEKNGNIVRVSDSIRATKWSALNTFFCFLKNEDLIQENPMEKTRRPQVNDNPDVAFLTESEMQKVIMIAKTNSKKKFRNRDICFLQLGFSTGLRISAIIQINLEDIDFDNRTIKVIEKGQKIRLVPIGEHLLKQIKLWITDREMYCDTSKSNALFLSSYNTRITRVGAQKILDKYTKDIPKRVTPHVMRHTCATTIYKETGDIYLCSEVLNHKNIATTQRYAAMCDDKKQKATSMLDKMVY